MLSTARISCKSILAARNHEKSLTAGLEDLVLDAGRCFLLLSM